MTGLWPNGKPDDPQTYLGGIAMVFANHARSVVTACIDPFHGIAAELKFLPTIADVTRWCHERESPLHHVLAMEHEEQQQLAIIQQRREEDAERETRPTLDALKDRFGPTFGLTVAGEEADREEQRRRQHLETLGRRSNARILREYEHHGVEPVYAGRGVPVSMSLRRQIAEWTKPQPREDDAA